MEELAGRLEVFQDYYNHERPHQGIGGKTPASRFSAGCKAEVGSALEERPPQTKAGYRTVCAAGHVGWGPYNLGVGMDWAGESVCVIQSGEGVEIFADHRLLRRLTLDPSRRYQATGKPPGRPPARNR